jgi:hypothetical protein
MEMTSIGWLAQLRITSRENAAYMECARRAGLDTHHWIRLVLNAAAAQSLGQEPTTFNPDADAE